MRYELQDGRRHSIRTLFKVRPFFLFCEQRFDLYGDEDKAPPRTACVRSGFAGDSVELMEARRAGEVGNWGCMS